MAAYKGKHPKKRPPKKPWWKYQAKASKRPPKPNSVDVAVRATWNRLRVDGISSTDFHNVFRFDRVESRTPGVNVPSYRKRILKHESATSSFDGTKFSFLSKSYSGKGRFANPTEPPPKPNSFVGTVWGTGDGVSLSSNVPTTPPSFSGTAYTSAYNQAVQGLYDAIRSIESPVGLGEDIGEYHQTVNLFKRGLSGLQDLIQYTSTNHANILKKGAQWNNAKRVAKSLGALVTEYRFGIAPLAKEIGEGAAAIVSDRYLDAFVSFKAKGKATSAVEKTDSTYGSFPALHVRGITHQTAKVRYKGEYRIRGDGGSDYLRSVGLTWREFTPTVYNLLPYSFLLDYVLNFHTFVEALSVPWANVAWCVSSERMDETYTAWYDFRQSDQNVLFTLQNQKPGLFKATASGVRRRAVSSIPFPTLQWQTPSVRSLQNTAAVLASKLPVIGNLTKRILRSPSGKALDYEFNLVARDRNLKVPYPFHRAP
jgi:hypothetical protein